GKGCRPLMDIPWLLSNGCRSRSKALPSTLAKFLSARAGSAMEPRLLLAQTGAFFDPHTGRRRRCSRQCYLEHPPSRVCDPHPRDLEGTRTGDDALGSCEAVRDHDRLAAAIAARCEQFEGAAAVGLGIAATAVRVGHGVVAAVDRVGDLQDTTRRPSE